MESVTIFPRCDDNHRYSSQLEAQQKETASAAATLEEAAREMDIIRTEKKALLQKWRSSLLQIERCDEQLSATEFASRQWKEKEMAIDGEITSFRKSIKNEQEKNELLVGQVCSHTSPLKLQLHTPNVLLRRSPKCGQKPDIWRSRLRFACRSTRSSRNRSPSCPLHSTAPA